MDWVRQAAIGWSALQSIHSAQSNTILQHPWRSLRCESETFPHLQRRLTSVIHQHQVSSLLSSLPTRESTRLLSVSGTGAGAFLTALPTSSQTSFANHELDLCIRLRLGIPLPGPSPSCVCGYTNDTFGDHFLTCNRGGEIQSRHNHLRDLLSSILSSTNCSTQREVPALNVHPNATSSPTNRRFDLIIRSGATMPISADVSIIHPTPINTRSLSRYSASQGSAALIREQTKRRIYQPLSTQLGMQFIPLILESYGTYGPAFASFLATMSRRASSSSSFCGFGNTSLAAHLLTDWRRRISCALQKANARLLQLRMLRGSVDPMLRDQRSRIDFGQLRLDNATRFHSTLYYVQFCLF